MTKPFMVLAALCIAALSTNDLLAQRKFAPGVVQTIKPVIDGRDASSLPMSLPGISADYINNAQQTDWKFINDTQTLLGQTRSVIFYRDVWQHEFSFLGLRQLNVTASNLDGDLKSRNIWYLVYRVRNVGSLVAYDAVEDPKFKHIDYEPTNDPSKMRKTTLNNRFFGSFELSGWVQDPQTGMYSEKSFQDMVSPSITRIIQQEEDPDRPLMDKIQLAQKILEQYPAESDEGGTWGVALWYNVDPALDFISVKVSGLTNAHRIDRNEDDSLTFRNKTLQLNFWRPGDGLKQADDPIVYGIPLTQDPVKQIEIARKYHLPGPAITGEILDMDSLRTTLIFEADPALDMIDFDSSVAKTLDKLEIPDAVRTAMTNAGFEIGAGASIIATIPGQQWTMNDTVDGEPRSIVIKLNPKFWEKNIDGGIRFIKSLENIWVYE